MFNSSPTEANVVVVGGLSNEFDTRDATTAVVSPVTVDTGGVTLEVPKNATTVILCTPSSTVQVSEDSTMSAAMNLLTNKPMTLGVVRQRYLYLKAAAPSAVSFMFKTI